MAEPAPAKGGLRIEKAPALDLYRKLVWLTGLRLVVGTALLASTAWITLGAGHDFGRRVDVLLYAIICSIYVGSLVSVTLLRTGRYLRVVAYAQIAGDVVAASGLVYLTGGAESIFTVLYPLAIVNAAITLSRRGAMVCAAASMVAFTSLALALERGALEFPATYFDRPPLPLPHLALTLGASLSAFLLTAALSAYLADALQGVRKQLARSETRLTALSALHENILHSLGSGLLTTDGLARITFLNPAGEEITGFRMEELRGGALAEFFPDFAHALGVTQPRRGEILLRRAGSEGRIVGFSTAPMIDPGTPEQPGFVIIFQDVTPIRRLEEAMRLNDRLASIGKLAAGLAHEIRNPLASMCGSIELLRDIPGLKEQDRRLMQIVLREGERLEQLVRDFLAFARPQLPELNTVDAGAAVEETLAIFRREVEARGMSMDARIEPALFVRADADQLKQVLWNLLRNAAEAMNADGKILVRLVRDGAHVVLEVEDSGLGIAASDLPHVFDPFFTTKESGTGLGLSIVHRIVEGHGGRVDVRSLPGQGTTFRIELVAAAPPIRVPSRSEPPKATPPGPVQPG